MFLIVLDNAVKFSPKGSAIEVIYKDKKIVIRDHGNGIAPQLLEHIFERFYKTRDERNKNGTGLGLAIAHQIAMRHGIKITASNAFDGGARFTFELP